MTFEQVQELYIAAQKAYIEAWMAYMRRHTPEERRRAFKVVMGGKAA
jgi:hypothetical protein